MEANIQNILEFDSNSRAHNDFHLFTNALFFGFARFVVDQPNTVHEFFTVIHQLTFVPNNNPKNKKNKKNKKTKKNKKGG